MDRRPARLNRTGLVLFGLLLALPGAAALARGLGAFGDGRASDTILDAQVRRWVDDHGWFWPAVTAAAIVLALLGLLWLVAQVRSRRLRDLTLEPEDAAEGSTHLSAKAVTDALEEEIGEYPGVQSVHGRLLGSSQRPRLRLNVAYDHRADLPDLRRRIEDDAVRHLCVALERDHISTVVRLRLVPGDRARTVL
ncbi:alkaline shock response membrane anchor protein AmaP [Actinomadura roseirufa]|uniref:alkaline shock response membrane anchor protein AmaP n=1 Tax=Actinomadura roseirufa TaxID=2094049 RepID=UPI001041591D|nr:alkaline shock response membrane anchor protein AmaP [Actinomadura roseirufa]